MRPATSYCIANKNHKSFINQVYFVLLKSGVISIAFVTGILKKSQPSKVVVVSSIMHSNLQTLEIEVCRYNRGICWYTLMPRHICKVAAY